MLSHRHVKLYFESLRTNLIVLTLSFALINGLMELVYKIRISNFLSFHLTAAFKQFFDKIFISKLLPELSNGNRFF